MSGIRTRAVHRKSKSPTTTKGVRILGKPRHARVHPGEILREEYLKPLGLSAIALAKALQVPRTRIERLVREESAITPDTAVRLGRYFSTSPEFWLNLQVTYEIDSIGDVVAGIENIVPRKIA